MLRFATKSTLVTLRYKLIFIVFNKWSKNLAILSRFSSYFETSDLQFGFKKKLSCSHAIYSIRNIVDHYIRGQSTVSLCFVDVSKAFDKMNHYALFLKLLKRKLPIQIVDILAHWLEASLTCVRRGSNLSHLVKLVSGVRQGVYYPRIYLHSLLMISLMNLSNRKSAVVCLHIFVYADDIVLVAPSVGSLLGRPNIVGNIA